MSILPQLERDLDAAANRYLPSGEAPGPRRRGRRFGAGVAVALSGAIVIVVAIVALSLRHGSATRRQTSSNLVAVGIPVPVRSLESGGTSETLQLQAVGFTRSSHSRVLATLLHPVAREPHDVCFGVFAASEGPASGDVLCSVRGNERLVAVIGQSSVAGAELLSYIVGQAPASVIRIEMLGLNGPRKLRLSAAHMFLATFAPAARGRVALRATLSDGRTLTTAFTLPLSSAQMQAFSDRYRRSGAVFNGEVGESIVGTPYREIVKRFGRPLATLSSSHGQRCVYYDVVGYDTGWSFCFKHGTMSAASGQQTPPPGVS
jgi:hypothetical protein